MGFSRQEYWSGLSFLSPGDLPDPGIEPGSPTLWAYSLLTELRGKPVCMYVCVSGLPGGLGDKESACQCRWCRFDPGWRRSPGGGNGNPLQYSCQENPMDRGAWRAIVHGVSWVGHNLATKPPYIDTYVYTYTYTYTYLHGKPSWLESLTLDSLNPGSFSGTMVG